jgi:hypothetical protein
VWILGHFENRPGSVSITLRRSSSRPEVVEELAKIRGGEPLKSVGLNASAPRQ